MFSMCPDTLFLFNRKIRETYYTLAFRATELSNQGYPDKIALLEQSSSRLVLGTRISNADALNPRSLLSILEFDMGAHSKGAYSRGGGSLKRLALYIGDYSKPCVFLHATIACYNHYRVGSIH